MSRRTRACSRRSTSRCSLNRRARSTPRRWPGMDADGRGAERRARAQGAKAGKLQAALVALDPDLGRWADEYVFGEVWSDGALMFEERMLVAITALAAQNRRAQLRNYLHGALQE